MAEEITGELRRLNEWAPSIDKNMDRLLLRTGEIAAGVAEIRNDVGELQSIVKNGRENGG